jgi:hypothetical protein
VVDEPIVSTLSAMSLVDGSYYEINRLQDTGLFSLNC